MNGRNEVSAVSMPSFTAESSLYRSARNYRTDWKTTMANGDQVIPALQWGSTWSHCEGTRRKYAAVLWDIPWGQNWLETCRSTPGPADVGGRVPNLCEEGWGHVWGNWWVYDSSCRPPT